MSRLLILTNSDRASDELPKQNAEGGTILEETEWRKMFFFFLIEEKKFSVLFEIDCCGFYVAYPSRGTELVKRCRLEGSREARLEVTESYDVINSVIIDAANFYIR